MDRTRCILSAGSARGRHSAAWLLAALCVGGVGVAMATQTGRSEAGIPFATGGISLGERQALHDRRAEFSLWVITAVSKSGAYLANVQVGVRDTQGRAVYEGHLDGPWLFVDLPPGRYEVQAVHGGLSQRRTTTIRAGEHRQLFFYFDTGDEVGAERIGPPHVNLFDGRGR